MVVRDFAEKLKLTADLLGCATQKDLCRLFREINPETEFDVQRSYNWMQGRSRPRSARVYEDWATLLGIGRPAGFLTSCSIDAFRDLIAEHFGLGPTPVSGEAAAPVSALGGGRGGAPAYLAGGYACYSHALSPYFKGKVIRGSLVVEPVARAHGPPSLKATYSETLAIGRIRLSGDVELSDRSVFLDLSEAKQSLRLFMVLSLPSPPAGVLGGVLAGATFVDSFSRPAATRIVIIRVGETEEPALLRSERYLDLAEEPLSQDLAALGIPVGTGQAAELDRLLEAFLWDSREPASYIHLAANALTELTLAVDRLILSRADARAAIPRASNRPAQPNSRCGGNHLAAPNQQRPA